MTQTKNIQLLLFVMITIAISASSASCNKSQSDRNNISIKRIAGNYKGGTLHWNNANGTSGSDPNFTFNVTNVNSNEIKLIINTNAIIFAKTFNVPLTDKIETNGSAQYTFSTSENTSTYSKTFMIIITVSSASPTYSGCYAQIDYFKKSTSSQDEGFDGDGFHE